ncbi:MAG: hypothetical protein U5R30_07015 [Deltaproteobacteria bacterium]|nr:hypothetical protein [Deltaproteobacteria bacterium]
MAVLSKGKLSRMMLERLLELPDGVKNLKENVTFQLGLVAQLSSTRDISAAWNETKKKAAKLHPDRFILDGRGILHWNDGRVKILDQNISSANFKKLNEFADAEGCDVNSMVSKLIASYKKSKKKITYSSIWPTRVCCGLDSLAANNRSSACIKLSVRMNSMESIQQAKKIYATGRY